MNITLLSNRDLASNFALNCLLPALCPDHKLSIFLSSAVGGAPAAPELRQLKFFEQGLFNTLLFPALVKFEGEARLRSFDQLARVTGTTITNLNKINTEDGLAALIATEPDLILSIRYGGILRERAIAVPPMGVLNLHSGLLPDYRGVMATFYAMLNGESGIGTTLHYIRDAGIDTGDIVSHTRTKLDYSHSYLWNVLQLYPDGIDTMLTAVNSISRGEPPAYSAQPAGGRYYSFPTVGQLQHFGEKGYKLYDVEEITDFAKYYLEP